MKKAGLLALVCLLSLAASSAKANYYNYTGTLDGHNDVLKFEFTVGEPSIVTLFTTSFYEAGLDLLLTIWALDGTLVTQNDDYYEDIFEKGGTLYFTGDADAYIEDAFATGSYIATLTVGGNWENSYLLSDGFEYDNETPLSIDEWSDGTATNFVSFHIVGASSVEKVDTAVVPEPGTLALIGIGMASLAFARKRFRNSAQR